MICECNNKSNRVKPGIKHVYGNVLRMAIPLTLRTLVKDGDEMVVTDTDFIPSSDHPVRVVFSRGKTNYPIIATMDGNVAIVEDKGKIPVGTYDISVECYDGLGNPYRFKQNAVLYVADTTAEAGIDEEIEYEAQTWYLNAAVFLATTQIGEIGDAIDAKLDDVFGNVAYDANAKEIRFYNKDNSRVLATIDSRPFIADGTVADVYIDVSRQVLVVVLNEDAGGTRFSVPLYLIFNSYYKKDEVDNLVSRTVEGMRFDFSQELPLVVHVTKNGSSYSSPVDFGVIENAIREDGRLVVACVNNDIFYQLLSANSIEIAFSRVVALDGYQELLVVDKSNVWIMEDVDLAPGGGGGGYEPPAGGIPKTDLASGVQASLNKADSAIQGVKVNGTELTPDTDKKVDVTVPTKLSDLAADATHRVVTDAEKSTWSGKQSAINDLDTIRSGAGKGATSVQAISVNGASLSPTDGNISISAVTGLQFDGSSHVGAVQLPEYVKKSDYDTAIAEYVKKSDYNTTIEDIYQSIPSDLADMADDATHRLVTDTEKNTWNGKQNVISDLSAIRSGAALGATALQSYTETDPTVPAWAKASTKPSYTASEVGAVPTTRTINGKALSSDITLSASDVGALPSNTHIPADQVQSNWNETNTSSKAYIQNKPTIPTVPTKVSSFANDAGYLTQHQSLANYYTKSEIDTKIGNIETILASI